MARKKKKKKGQDPVEAEADLTPMIDVTFLLLIFFVLNIKFKSEEGEIESYLPKSRGQGSGTPSIDLNEVRLKLLWYDLGGNPTTDEDNGFVVVKIGRNAYNNAGEIKDEMDSLRSNIWDSIYNDLVNFKTNYKGGGKDGLPVIIDAREQIPYYIVVTALNQVVKAEIKDVTFAAPEKPY